MDIEFAIQDAFAHVRPRWKIAPNLEEAGTAFAEAVARNYQTQTADKTLEVEEAAEDSLSEEGIDDENNAGHQRKGDSSEENEVTSSKAQVVRLYANATQEGEDIETPEPQSESEEEQFVVKGMENERDPEADADFDRELAKMMSESVESRKFERKPLFDVPLPMRRTHIRESAAATDDSENEAPAPPAVAPSTMKFSLLSKRGNRQQVRIAPKTFSRCALIRLNKTRSIDLPSDSNFAVAMRNQQQAERAEQQRIKNLVLNYDLREENEQDGDSPLSSLQPNPNRKPMKAPIKKEYDQHTYQSKGNADKHAVQPRFDKAGNSRSTQRARKLQLSDVDWH